ncbi:MAG: bifunctional YncE family protein/alkaline phosphatase family protein, partial [Nocardioidaceae bacterium]
MTRPRFLTPRRSAAAATALVLLGTGTAIAGGLLHAGPQAKVPHAGPQGDGTSITPAGWYVDPAGRQTQLGDLPTAEALSPNGRWLVVMNAGQATQSLQVVDASQGDVVQTIPYESPEGLYAGLAWGPHGKRLFASAGGNNKVRVFRMDTGQLTERRSIAIPSTKAMPTPYPAGLAVAPDGSRLYVADQLGDAFSQIDLATRTVRTVSAGHNPYGVALSPDGATAYVSDQGARTVDVYDVSRGAPRLQREVAVGTHPNRMVVDPVDGTLYVANSESDSVSVLPEGAARPTARIDLSPYRGAPVGSNPDGLALSPDRKTLYVVNSGNNDVAVVDLAANRVVGMIPTAWYPTDVTVSAAGDRLFVTNAKGLGAGRNDIPLATAPNPYHETTSPAQYVGSMIVGTLSRIPVPRGTQRLAELSQRVVQLNGFDERNKVRTAGTQTSSVVPTRVGESSPIKHVIYIVKENRTYDQEFGSLGKGNGAPRINLFGHESAPNARALQRRFVTLDNFYANAEVSTQGWNWSVGSNSNPYVEQTWPAAYSGRNHPYDYEGGNPSTAMNRKVRNSYLWDRLTNAGIGFRSFGFYKFGPTLNSGYTPPDPKLAAHDVKPYYGYDLGCPDSPITIRNQTCPRNRFSVWQHDFRAHGLPSVELVRLPNDHTTGTLPGTPTPRSYVGDNDWALGRLVDEVSHSRYWKSTAIFVVEDDAQNGPDHVDAHRTLAQVISPYTQTGRVDSTFYSTVSMLRTIELFVGIGPMTQFDAAATPMLNAFAPQPNAAPYDAVKPASISPVRYNTASSPMAGASKRQDLTQEDRIDEQSFNKAIWKSVNGADSQLPAPRHGVMPSSDKE